MLWKTKNETPMGRMTLTRGRMPARASASAVSAAAISGMVVRDRPGFIVNLLLIPFLLDAIRWLDGGLATKEEIDAAAKLGLNHPMGPIALSDFIGLDTVQFIADALFEEFRESRYAAPALLRRMVKAGLLGRKTGRGFYSY